MSAQDTQFGVFRALLSSRSVPYTYELDLLLIVVFNLSGV